MNGHIRKRGKNSWQLIFDLPRDADGKRKQARRTVHGTKREADSKLRELVSGAEKGDYVTPSKESARSYLAKWLAGYAATNTSLRTQEDYDGIVRRYIEPKIGSIPLSRLRPEHLDDLYGEMKQRGLSARTILHTHRILREALSHAIKRRLLTQNVCDAVDPPRPERKEMVSLDEEELARLLSNAETSYYSNVLFVASYTGLRRSEILALKWSSVDLDGGSISVVAGLHRIPGHGLVTLPTKTQKSRRLISITSEVADVLRQTKGAQILNQVEFGPLWQDSGFVFTQPGGAPIDPELVTQAFAKIAKAAGFKGIRLHDLRHTHASLMMKGGVTPKVVSERLGHSSIAVTMDIYSHVLPGLQEEAAQRFAKLLKPKEQSNV